MQCATHPNVETELACGKCGKPICPRCLVYTPVGTRCRECANIRRLPQYHISAVYLLRGAGAALGAGVALGGLWGILLPYQLGLFFGLMVGVGVGYCAGEAVSLAANRKSGPPLQALAVLGVVVAFLLREVIEASQLRHAGISDVLTNDTVGYVVAIIAGFVAVGRLR
jgi:hypothetical protein